MDNELRFIVSLKDNASHQAKRIQNNLGAFNRTYTSNIRLNLIDNISHRLRGIFSMLGGEGGFTRLFSFDSPSIKNGIKKLGSSISSIFKSDDNKKWFEKTVGYFKEAEKYAVRFGSSLVTAFAIGGAGIVAGFGVASAVLSKQLVKINSEMEQFEVSLQTTLGSLTAAKQEMAEIVQFAKETPYEIRNITDAVVKLRAYSMDSDMWLEPLGNAASAFGRDITDAVEMAADAVQGMFRRALSYGIRMDREMFKQGGKYAGMTYAEALMMELEKRFKGGMELQAKTLKGIWSNLKDTLYIQFQEATSPIYGIIKKQVQNLYEYLGSEQGQAKLRQLFKTMSSFIAKFMEIGKQVFSFIKASIVPIVQTVGKAMIRTFMTISEMLEPLKALLEPFISALTSVLTVVSKIITANETLLKIFVGYVVATRIMKMLGFSVGKLAANMVATNKAATMLGATISTLGKLAFGLGAAFVGMWAIGSYLEVRNNLKEIGVHIHNFALGADEVKQHLKEIGEETGKTLKDMTKIALAAKQFGHNMGNVIEQSAKAAGKAREGLPKNLGDFGLDEEAITEAIGTLAEALIAEGDSFETMKRKTEEAGDTLANLMRLSELTGLSFEDLAIAISNNGTTVERYADKIKDLQYLMVQFGIAAKQLGKDVSPDKFLQALEMLYTPTQEMLLELPLGTWIAKNLSEMDIDAISKNLSGILNPTEVERVITKFGDTAREILDKQSVVFLENIQDSATVFVDATEQAKDNVMAMSNKLVQSSIDFSKNIASASGLAGKEGAGGSDTEQLGLWGRFLNGIYSHWEVATAVTVAAIAGLAVLNRLNLQVARRTEKAIVGIAAEPPSTRLGKTIKDSMSKVGMDQEFFRNRYVKMEEKLIAKALPKNMLGRIETAIELQTKQTMKDWKEEFKSLERDLKVTRDAYNRGILSQVMKAGFGGGERAVPPGMTPEEFLTRFPEEAFKNMSELEIKVFEIWKGAFTEQIARLEDELSESRAKALDKIRQMTESYNELAEAIKKGRIPSRFKDMIKEIKDLTKNMEIAGDKFNLFGRKAKAAAETTTERGMAPTQRQVTPIRKAILFGLLSVLDLRGWKMTFASFKKGMNLRTIRESLLGVTRIIGDFLVLTKNNMEAVFKAAVGRASSLTIGRLSGRAMGRVRGFFTGRVGIVPEGMQGGYFQPGANEQFRWQPMVDYLKKIYNTLLGKQKGVLTVKNINVTGKNLGDAFVEALFKNFENIKVEALVGNRLVSLMDVLTYIFEAKAKVYAGELSGRIYIETRDALWENFFKAATRQLPAGPAESVVTTAQSTSTALEKVGSRAVERISSVAQASVEVINESGEVIKQLSSSAVKEIEGVARKALPPASGTDIVKAQTDLVKAGSRALVKFERTNLPTARARMIYPPFSYEIIRDSTNQLSKDIKEGTKATKAQAAWLGAMVLSMADSLGTQYLEPYFQKLIDQGSMWGAVGMTAYKTFMPTEWPIIGDTIRELGNSVLMLTALLPSVAPVAIPLAYAGTGVGNAAGMLGKVAGGGALERGVDISYDLETWYEEATFQIGKLMVEGTEQLGHGIKEALITAADYVEKGFTRINSLVHGGGGKIPEFEAELTEKIWGTEAAEYEKEIEKQFDRYKDVKAREEAYAKLHEQKVLAYTEETTRKREFMLEVLANITKENYRVLEEAGKTASQPLIDELDRANKWVKENIFAGTDLATQEAVAKMVTEFQKGSQLAVEVYTSTLEGMLEGFDLETPEGVKHFLEEMAKMKGDAEAGQIALDMMIVAMQKTQDEIDRVAAQIEGWNEELEELNRQISEANIKLREFDQQLVGLNQAFTNVTTALDLAIARNELDLVSESAQNLQYEIAQLAVELSTAEYQMLPLQKALNQTEKEFDAIQDAIDKTQQKLDDFMNAPIEGEGAYREQRYQIERQIAEKEHAIEAAQRALAPFEKAGLTGSDTYKMAAAQVTVLEDELEKLQTTLSNIEYDRENLTAPVEHAKDMAELAQQGAEKSSQAIIDGIKLESEKLTILQQQADKKQTELDLAQSLVDKKQEEIDGITDAMGLKEKELEIIQKQVEADNKLVQNLKDKLTAEQKIRDLSAQIVEIDSDHLKMQGLVSAQKLQQLTIEYALGNVGKEGLLAVADMYTKVGTQIADITGQKTPYANEVAYLNFDVEGLAEKIAAAEKENEARAAIRDALYEAIKQGIGDIDIEALSKSDLESVFGGNIGDIISRMGQNIAVMANKQNSEKAVGYRSDWFAQILKNVGVATYASGGIELAQQSLAMLHGPEAIIPLQNGAVPVTLYGAGTQGGGETVVNQTTVEIGSIVVRDNEDLEEIKGAILALRQGQVNFFSRASQYPERF